MTTRIFFTSIILVLFTLSCSEENEEPIFHPTIYNQFFTIEENSLDGTEVGTVEATIKNDTDLFFYLLSEGVENTFVIEKETGIISINDNTLINSVTNNSFTLIIKVTNSLNEEYFATAVVVISVIDGLNTALVYYNFNGDFNDASNTDYHGTGNASFTYDRFGSPNSAASFNGIDQYVDFPLNTQLKPELPVSFSFWVHFNDLDFNNTQLFDTDFIGNIMSGVIMGLSSEGKVAIGYGDALGTFSVERRRTKVGTTSIQPGEWYHIAGVVKGPTDMQIYINGVDDGGTYSGYGDALGYTADTKGSIGRKYSTHDAPPNYFSGMMDDFAYWDIALSQEKVEKLFNLKN